MNRKVTALALLLTQPFAVSAGAADPDPATRDWA